MDFNILAVAFVVVVVGGMGSIFGAFWAAVLFGVLQTFGIQILPNSTLVLMFLVMAVVLIFRPWGLLGMRRHWFKYLPVHPSSHCVRPCRGCAHWAARPPRCSSCFRSCISSSPRWSALSHWSW